MKKIKDVSFIPSKSRLQVALTLLLILLALLLLWVGNTNSMQAEPALVAQVYFEGEYRIEDGSAQKICGRLKARRVSALYAKAY